MGNTHSTDQPRRRGSERTEKESWGRGGVLLRESGHGSQVAKGEMCRDRWEETTATYRHGEVTHWLTLKGAILVEWGMGSEWKGWRWR